MFSKFRTIAFVCLGICFSIPSEGYTGGFIGDENPNVVINIGRSESSAEENLLPLEEWERVYLATFPRSGNHWTRFLLEEATHIATSSVYHDLSPWHLKEPFPWGGYAPKYGYRKNCRYPDQGETVVIKTHYPARNKTRFDLLPAKKVIRIVRHPLDSFYSYYLFGEKKIPEDGKVPRKFVVGAIKAWKRFETYWNGQEDVLTIRYEDLFSDPYTTLSIILEAIGYSFTQEDVDRAVAKFPPQGGVYKHLSDFHLEDLELIWEELGPLMEGYGYNL